MVWPWRRVHVPIQAAANAEAAVGPLLDEVSRASPGSSTSTIARRPLRGVWVRDLHARQQQRAVRGVSGRALQLEVVGEGRVVLERRITSPLEQRFCPRAPLVAALPAAAPLQCRERLEQIATFGYCLPQFQRDPVVRKGVQRLLVEPDRLRSIARVRGGEGL